jgi:glutamate formiminotransferase/formiminotetrahydrofolate cyclodeaminase
MGATDVVPFIPLRGVTMEDCAELACQLGRRVGDELDIPVYLYEAAATRPERINLADVRRGEYEGLKEAIQDPDRAPDFGPAHIGKAGATAIGARQFLIAFNVYLNSDDVTVAKRIAKAVRHSSGGLRYVKALGLLVEGQAQVSMNLTDYTRTPIHRVLELVRREAASHGVMVARSELVGLLPQQALIDGAAWYLQLDLDPDQVLESRLEDGDDLTPFGFLEAVSSKDPAPGGGSVAALSGALAGALTAMVGRLTQGRKGYEDAWTEMESLIESADSLRSILALRVSEDSQAYDSVVAAFRLPKGSAKEKAARKEAIQAAIINAARVPLATARDSVKVLELTRIAAQLGNLNALSDIGTAAHMARAAFEGAALNVRINADQITDSDQVDVLLGDLAELRKQCALLSEETLTGMEERWPS